MLLPDGSICFPQQQSSHDASAPDPAGRPGLAVADELSPAIRADRVLAQMWWCGPAAVMRGHLGHTDPGFTFRVHVHLIQDLIFVEAFNIPMTPCSCP